MYSRKYISNLSALQNDETRSDLDNYDGMIGGSNSPNDDSMDITEDNANINNEQGIFVLGIKRMQFPFLIF